MKLKNLMASTLILGTVLSTSLPVAEAASFHDVSGHWGATYINNVADKGLFAGYDDGTFRPDQTMSRAEFVTVVVQALFPDSIKAADGDWYTPFFNAAEEWNLLPSNFTTNLNLVYTGVTRQEMAYIIRYAMAAKNTRPSQIIETEVLPDYSDIGSAYRESVLHVVSLGIMAGRANGNFDGSATVSRAEASVVLWNMITPDSRAEVYYTFADLHAAKLADAILPDNQLNPSYNVSRFNLTLEYYNPNRPTAKVGDTLNLSGTSHAVIAHPSGATVNGHAVPYVEGVAMDLGITTTSGHGSVTDGFTGGSQHQNGETFYVNPWLSEGYWQSQWDAILALNPAPNNSGSNNQTSPDKMYVYQTSSKSWVPAYTFDSTDLK